MVARPKFTVDESFDPKIAEQAIRDLRRMIRYGRMAERAMQSIREKGYYDGQTPLAPKADENTVYYGPRQSVCKQKSNIVFSRLPARQSISRDDLGPMDELRLELGKVKDTRYSGNPCKEVPIFLIGPMVTQIKDGLPVYSIEEERRQIGKVRVNKGGLSWLENDADGDGIGIAHRLYKEMKYAGAKESLRAFAKGVSKMLVLRYKSEKEFIFAAKTVELQATAWEWFIADGHAERLCRDIHELVRIAEVMES